ncbi:MAG: hypothetical protein KGL15_11470 [Acidobacteriota bacterium]|nr:hypothetical protein [Acidobacteriota bacterium]
MSLVLALSPFPASPRCSRCHEVIGVYEPAVTMIGCIARRTSRAADPELSRAAAAGAEQYHLACFEARAGEQCNRR